MYTYKEMELMTENATLKERCAQLEKRIDVYENMIAILSKDKVTIPPTINPNTIYPLKPDVPFQYGKGCPKCGIGADGGPLGYVCNDPMCPCGLGGTWCSTNTTK